MTFNPLRPQPSVPSMQDFYREHEVLLTGATGFLGKIILLQLLKTEVRKIFLIVRARKDQTCSARVQALFAKDPFSGPVDPRIEVVEGDITKPNLGLSTKDEAHLRSKVTVFINNAASVSFENTLKAAVEANVISTLETLLLAKSWRLLKCFVYVSTAFSNCTMPIVEEKVYKHTFVSVENLLRAYDNDPSSLLKWNTHGHPNTYTFSKQHAEALVASSGLPHVIVRPPVIVGSFQDPICGWVDNFNGYNSFALLSEKGRNPPMFTRRKNAVALAPVDICANVILGAVWRRSFREENSVYNCTHTQTAPKSGVMFDTFNDAVKGRTPERYLRGATNRLSQFIVFAILFLIPAFFTQLYNIFTGNPERPLVKVRRARQRCAMMEYFLTKKVVFEYNNVRELSADLPAHEKHIFKMDISEINWQSFLSKTAVGLLQYAEKSRDRKKNGGIEAATTKL